LNQGFLFELLAAFPYWFIFYESPVDPNAEVLRNVMMLKLLRITRLLGEFIPDDQLLSIVQYFYRPESRDEKIQNDRLIINIIKIVKQILTTLMTTYFLGLLWYRFSDSWQATLTPNE
jgi:hypothetical protein